jgi:hypothetical protein
MDTVILKQFEEYLQTRGIKAQSKSKADGNQTSTRLKRSTEPRVLDTLSKKEVFICSLFSRKRNILNFNYNNEILKSNLNPQLEE